jgi:putative protease
VASFVAAAEAGADAVYLGLSQHSARRFAQNFTLAEFRSVLREARGTSVRVYLAFNSLLKETELLEGLSLLDKAASYGPDGIIVQDLGAASFLAKFYPKIPLHASTLLNTHNLAGLEGLRALGFSRAVLPREFTITEIESVARKSPLELECFVHGALCFSVSGLCLFSSFLGGKSALRGACAQPCRRAYSQGGGRFPFFSANDLEAINFLPELRKIPIKAYKIEGRMKGADYVAKITRAYRLVLDAPPDEMEEAIPEAQSLLAEAPERARCQAFLPGFTRDAGRYALQGVAASGLKLGLLHQEGPQEGTVELLAPLQAGARVRLYARVGDEGISFKVAEIRLDGESVAAAAAGAKVSLALPPELGGEKEAFSPARARGPREAKEIPRNARENSRDAGEGARGGARAAGRGEFKTSGRVEGNATGALSKKESRGAGRLSPRAGAARAGAEASALDARGAFLGVLYLSGDSRKDKEYLESPLARAILKGAGQREERPVLSALKEKFVLSQASPARAVTPLGKKGAGRGGGRKPQFWVWVDRAKDILETQNMAPLKAILPLSKANAFEAARLYKRSGRALPDLVWSLPPLIYPAREGQYRGLIDLLVGKGAREFMAGSLGGASALLGKVSALQEKGQRRLGQLKVYLDYRLGPLNHLAARALQNFGVALPTLSLETDWENYKRLKAKLRKIPFLLYYYGKPPLFTARLNPNLKRGPVMSPRGEKFWPLTDEDSFFLYPEKSVFLGPLLSEGLGPEVAGLVVDLRGERKIRAKAEEIAKMAYQGRARGPGVQFNLSRGLE